MIRISWLLCTACQRVLPLLVRTRYVVFPLESTRLCVHGSGRLSVETREISPGGQLHSVAWFSGFRLGPKQLTQKQSESVYVCGEVGCITCSAIAHFAKREDLAVRPEQRNDVGPPVHIHTSTAAICVISMKLVSRASDELSPLDLIAHVTGSN